MLSGGIHRGIVDTIEPDRIMRIPEPECIADVIVNIVRGQRCPSPISRVPTMPPDPDARFLRHRLLSPDGFVVRDSHIQTVLMRRYCGIVESPGAVCGSSFASRITSRTQPATVRDITTVTKTCLILPVMANGQMIKGSAFVFLNKRSQKKRGALVELLSFLVVEFILQDGEVVAFADSDLAFVLSPPFADVG